MRKQLGLPLQSDQATKVIVLLRMCLVDLEEGEGSKLQILQLPSVSYLDNEINDCLTEVTI